MLDLMIANIRKSEAHSRSILWEGNCRPEAPYATENLSVQLAELVFPPLQDRIAFVTEAPVFLHNGEPRWVKTLRSQATLKGDPLTAVTYPDLAATAAQMVEELRAYLDRFRPTDRMVPLALALTGGIVVCPQTFAQVMTFHHRFAIVEAA